MGSPGESPVLPASLLHESIAAAFERAVTAHRDRVAVRDRGVELTYDALNRAANRLARAIRGRGTDPTRPVALVFPQGAPALTAILAALKAGVIYTVADPRARRARLSSVMRDAAPGAVVTGAAHLGLAAELRGAAGDVELIDADAVGPDLADDDLGLAIEAGAAAVISYTSGSTGTPRGVVSAHREVLHRAVDFANTARLTPADRLAILNSLATGASFRDTFGGLLAGATVYPYDVSGDGLAALPTWLAEQRITVCHCAASIFRAFAPAAPGGRFPDLRLVWVGHEPVLPSDVDRARTHLVPGCLFVNGMGISEAGTVSHVILDTSRPFDGDVVPVGRPIPGKDVFVLDDDGRDVGREGVGEVVVRSEYLAQGYWRRPEQTAEIFRPDPAGGPARLYRTGDLGRWLPDGNLILLGRKNALSKLGGEFVDLSAVEAALLRQPNVHEATAMVREDRAGAPRLVAYVVASPPPTWTALRDALSVALPPRMVPAAVLYLGELPRTPNGKIDRRALPAPDRRRPRMDTPYVPAQTPLEAWLAETWAAALELDKVGAHDSFLELGGDSLRAALVINQIREQFGGDVPLATLAGAATVAEMAISLAELLLASSTAQVPPFTTRVWPLT